MSLTFENEIFYVSKVHFVLDCGLTHFLSNRVCLDMFLNLAFLLIRRTERRETEEELAWDFSVNSRMSPGLLLKYTLGNEVSNLKDCGGDRIEVMTSLQDYSSSPQPKILY